ncbi:helix-turn-helix transcriptional regulator [Alkalihalophilus marmarensis]|uniref:helix-turn-helix transcriptional regulator n=1 Tax=Alkalihalophilus marmarensis TaxID=521377 RepID=UPI002E1AD8A9|nr:helix-turn-helix transcriptional regulator [Alkalihalophilus marmarensis]
MKLKKRLWLINLRNELGLTQENVAERAKIDRSTYTKAEIGYPLRVTTAKAIAAVLECRWTLFFENDCDFKGQNNDAC